MNNKILEWAKKHKIAVWIFNIVFIIVFINAITFNETFNRILKSELCQSEIKQVNFYMAGAATIDNLYLIPIFKTINGNNPLLKPIFFVRDSLYNKGISYLPKNDAEKYVWWYYIKFMPFISSKSKMNTSNPQKYLDDIYDNLQSFYKYPIKNQKYKLDRYEMFITTANLYVFDLIHSYRRNSSVDNLYKDEKQVKKIDDLFTLFTNVRADIIKSEPETLKKFHNSNSRFEEVTLVNGITQLLIENELYKNPNKCDKPLIIFHWQSVSTLQLFLEHQKLYNLSNCQKIIIQDRLHEDTPFLKKVSKICEVDVPIITIKERE